MNEHKLNICKNMTLLLVDDDPIVLDNMKSTLMLFFKHIIIAKNGAEAFEIYKYKTIDIVITDYVMPVMDGSILCKKIRELNQNIPLLVISNHSEKEKLLSVIPLNLITYLLKPVSFDELTKTLLGTVERMEQQKQLSFKICSGVIYDKFLKMIYKDGELVKISKSEIALIELFIKHRNRVVTYEMLSYALNDCEPSSYHSMKNIIYRLRDKIGKNFVINVQSMGFVYHDEDFS